MRAFLESIPDDIGHMIEATVMMLIWLPLGWWLGWWLPALFVFGFYAGREIAQFESHERKRLGLASLKSLSLTSWQVWRWPVDQIRDLTIPTLYALFVCFIAGMVW